MLLLLLTGCPKGLGGSPKAASLYAFELHGSFSTQATAQDQSLPDLVEAGTGELHLRGQLRRAPSRVFRDGSRGWTLRFEEVEQAPEAGGPWIESGLSGRSVELRGFDSGEILAIEDAEHIAGPERHGEVFDLLFPAVSPVVPELSPGDSAWRRNTWPVVVASNRAWQNHLVASWTHEGREGGDHRLSYQGKVEGKGKDGRADALTVQSGEASGELLLRGSDLRVLQHQLDWTRVVEVSYGERIELVQTQRLSGSVRLIGEENASMPAQLGKPTSEDDAAPTGRYLSSVEVHTMLLEQLPLLASCYENSSAARARTELGEVYVNWQIAGDGSVRNATLHESRSGLPELDACLVEAVEGLRFRPHDEAPMDIGYPFVYRDARLQPYPMVFVKERPLHPLFVWLGEDAEVAASLLPSD